MAMLELEANTDVLLLETGDTLLLEARVLRKLTSVAGRTLSSIGTNRDVSSVGTNRDVETW